MRYIVRDIDAHDFIIPLKEAGKRLIDDPEFTEEVWIDAEGSIDIRKSFRTVLYNGLFEENPPHSFYYNRIFIGDPGERCITIEGGPLFVKGILEVLNIPTDDFVKRFCPPRAPWGVLPHKSSCG